MSWRSELEAATSWSACLQCSRTVMSQRGKPPTYVMKSLSDTPCEIDRRFCRSKCIGLMWKVTTEGRWSVSVLSRSMSGKTEQSWPCKTSQLESSRLILSIFLSWNQRCFGVILPRGNHTISSPSRFERFDSSLSQPAITFTWMPSLVNPWAKSRENEPMPPIMKGGYSWVTSATLNVIRPFLSSWLAQFRKTCSPLK